MVKGNCEKRHFVKFAVYLVEKPDPKYRCAQQTCFGADLYCLDCVVQSHRLLPTHWIEEWNGSMFVRKSLADLGLVIQLGHPVDYPCLTATDAHKNFTLIDVTGVHLIKLRFCHCDSRIEHRQQLMRVRWWPATALDPQTCATFAVVRLFLMQNCLGKITAHDFLRSLEFLTNNDGLDPPPGRRRAFRHIVRQYRMMTRMKRAGRGHADSGVLGTAQGELVLRCRACPQPGRNLPPDWDKIDWESMPEDLRYKYFLLLAQDCNFRLINRAISSEAKDPIVDDGMGHFVNQELYTKFLRNHVSEEEISSCSGFQAMFLANKKRVRGLRTTGVGGVTCARHNMWRANGIGDLQLGERFCNMDFIMFSSLLNTIILYLILSYDIACQYSKKIWTRMPGLPEHMHLNVDFANVWFKVPNFHLPPHKPWCHSPFSFHWMWGAGRTHGETIEQNWEFTNGAASSTKMMGIGARHSALEDLFSFHNWRRTVSNRGILAQRMAENLKEGREHREAFEAFDITLRAAVPTVVEGWKTWVHEWESKQHQDGTDSPFELVETGYSMKDIRLKLAKQEVTQTGEGDEIEREDTPSTFVVMGFELEQTQRILAIDVKSLADPTPLQTLDFVKRRAAVTKRVRGFRRLQRRYMPRLRRHMTPAQRSLLDGAVQTVAEETRLFLPSSIGDADKRDLACASGLAAIEEELREAEALEALEELRQGLRTRTMTNRYRIRNATGQRALTRGQGVLRQISLRIHKAKLRYRYARNALMRLRGSGPWEQRLRVLEEGDIRALNERALTEEEEARKEMLVELGAVIEGGVSGVGSVAANETHRKLSWIWYTGAKAGEPDEAELTEALRVEWCKAYARMRRWREDVVIVDEEMRRTIEYGYWMAAMWEVRATARSRGVDEALKEGLAAYAQEHVKREQDTCILLQKKYTGIRAKAHAYLAGEAMDTGQLKATINDPTGYFRSMREHFDGKLTERLEVGHNVRSPSVASGHIALGSLLLVAAHAGPCSKDTKACRVDGAVRGDEGEVHAQKELCRG
ncbi:hypothetical protein C8R44DRAFT_740790 [Mycena epipterygia]|nr:hypothetical protein C8R44DRAFT_740790 [Mycena epipterygia]